MSEEKMTVDFASRFREDITKFPRYIVISGAQRHLRALYDLDDGVPDKARAISDVEAFLEEHLSGQ